MGKEVNAEVVATAQRLLDFLKANRETLAPLLILTHEFPDPDALGSAFGLQWLLRQHLQIESRIVYTGAIGRMENREMVRLLKIPAHKLRPGELKRYRQVALVDTQPVFANNAFPANRKAALVIDQHPAEQLPNADLALVDPLCGATSVIVARALLMAEPEIPARVATALAYGILADTLDLYRARRADVVQTYLDIIRFCDMKALAHIQNPPHSRAFLVALGQGITQATAYRRVLVAHLGVVPKPELVAQIADFLLTYQNANWVFCTGRHAGRLAVSLRAERQDANAADVLRDLFPDRSHAGGHGVIAGGSLKVGRSAPEEVWHAAEQALEQKLAARLRLPAKGEFRRVFQPREPAEPPESESA